MSAAMHSVLVFSLLLSGIGVLIHLFLFIDWTTKSRKIFKYIKNVLGKNAKKVHLYLWWSHEI